MWNNGYLEKVGETLSPYGSGTVLWHRPAIHSRPCTFVVARVS